MIDISQRPHPVQDTVVAAFARAVAATPDGIFLDCDGERFSFRTIDERSTRFGHGLLALGVKAGEPVATILDNNADAVTLWLAINKIGAISAPVNTAFKGDFLAAQLVDCGSRVVIAEADYAARVAAVSASLPDLTHLVVRDGELPAVQHRASVARLDDLIWEETAPIEDTSRPEQTAILVYTSGTTGASKGCMIPHNLPCNMGRKNVDRGLGPGDVIWTPLPLFHMHAIAVTIVTAILARCTAAIAPRFSVSQFWPEVERTGATVVNLLGSMVALIADAPDHPAQRNAARLRRVNAAPFPPDVAARWQERFGISGGGAGAYGMTEAGTIAGLAPDAPPPPPGSSGRIGLDFDIVIADDNDNPLPTGSAGEILCRPRYPNIMFAGYWGRPEATVAAWRNLWFHTGDLGRIDENGFLFFVDRKKDYIRRRGENISTQELEGVFRQHPAIRDVAVHSVLSDLGEDEVKVTAEIRSDDAVTEEALCRWSIDRLPFFAVPRYVEFRDVLPRGATGKVLKHELRSDGKTARTWDRETAGVTFSRR